MNSGLGVAANAENLSSRRINWRSQVEIRSVFGLANQTPLGQTPPADQVKRAQKNHLAQQVWNCDTRALPRWRIDGRDHLETKVGTIMI